MRLFVALDLENEVRERISTYLLGVSGFAPEARWATAGSLHVTLKFIGEQPENEVARIQEALGSLLIGPFTFAIRGYGFFPTAKAARVFWLGIEADKDLPNLAAQVDSALATLEIPREEHGFRPHLTLARSGSGAPRIRREDESTSRFERLQKQLSLMTPPDFGTIAAREFHLYQSRLSPGGSRYSKLASFPLQG